MQKIKMPTFMYFEKKENVIGLMTNWIKECEGKYLVDEPDLIEFTGYKECDKWLMGDESHEDDTHKCLVIKSSIGPIQREKIEDIVDDLVNGNYPSVDSNLGALWMLNDFKERFKKALEAE